MAPGKWFALNSPASPLIPSSLIIPLSRSAPRITRYASAKKLRTAATLRPPISLTQQLIQSSLYAASKVRTPAASFLQFTKPKATFYASATASMARRPKPSLLIQILHATLWSTAGTHLPRNRICRSPFFNPSGVGSGFTKRCLFWPTLTILNHRILVAKTGAASGTSRAKGWPARADGDFFPGLHSGQETRQLSLIFVDIKNGGHLDRGRC